MKSIFKLIIISSFLIISISANAQLTGLTKSAVAYADYNNDNYLDFIMSGEQSNGTEVAWLYKNNGNGTFSYTNSGIWGTSEGSVDWGDYNRDGYLDLLICGIDASANRVTKVYRNYAGIYFYEDTTISLTGINGVAKWADLDNDGDLDIIMAGNTTSAIVSPNGFLRAYKNNGNQVFTQGYNQNLYYTSNVQLELADFNNDNYIDIIYNYRKRYSNYGTTYYYGETWIRRNNGSWSFSGFQPSSGSGYHSGALSCGDYNNDGHIDILISGLRYYSGQYEYATKLYKNDGYPTFTEVTNANLLTLSGGSSVWGDINNDGYEDIIISGSTTSYSKVTKTYYNQNGAGTFSSANLTGLHSGDFDLGDINNDGDIDILMTGYSTSGPYSNLLTNNVAAVNPNTAPSTPSGLITEMNGNDLILKWNKSTDAQTAQEALQYNLRIGATSNSVDIKSPHSNISTGFWRITDKSDLLCDTFFILDVTNFPSCTDFYWSVQAVDNGLLASAFATENLSTKYFLGMGQDKTINLWDSVQISAIMDTCSQASFVWTPSAGLSNPNIKNPKASPSQTTTYKVTASVNGLQIEDSLIVTVIQPYLVMGSDKIINYGDSAEITAQMQICTQANYVWSDGATLNDSTSNITLASPSQTTTYTVTATCSGFIEIDSLIVTVLPPSSNIETKSDRFGGSGTDIAKSIVETLDGYIFCGYTNSTDYYIDTLRGNYDFWVVRVDNFGDTLWSKTYGGTNFDLANSIVATPDSNFIIAGYSSSNDIDVHGNHGQNDIWVIKINQNGDTVWTKSYGGNGSEFAYHIIKTKDDNFVIAGYSTSSNNGDVIGANVGYSDPWYVKINTNGTILWSKLYGESTYNDRAHKICQKTDSTLISSGYYQLRYSHCGGYHCSYIYYSYHDFGRLNLLDKDGNLISRKKPVNYDPTQCYDVVNTLDSQNIVLSKYNSTWHITKVNNLGNNIWNKSLAVSSNNSPKSIVANNQGGYMICGNTNISLSAYDNHGSSDYWTALLSSSGDTIFTKSFGGTGYDDISDLITTSDGGYLMVGNTSSTDGDPGSTSYGMSDAWILRFGFKPEIISQSSDSTICQNDTLLISVTKDSLSNMVTYQWQKNSLNIIGANSDSLVLDALLDNGSNIFKCILTNAYGVDTSDAITVNVMSTNYTIHDTICIIDTSYYNPATNISNDTLITSYSSSSSCDSIVTRITYKYPKFKTIDYDTICNGNSYYFGGQWLIAAGIYTDTLTTNCNCDSILELHLHINQNTTGDTNAVVCNSFSWYGTNHTISGNYTHTLTNHLGCDSVVTLHLTINNSNTGDTTAVACNSFSWYGTNHTMSGNYTHTLTNHLGCDSVVTLHLTINNSNIGDTTAVTCNSFSWDGTNHTTSGNYTHTLINHLGCDSVVTLHLTINYSNTGDTTAVACNSFSWYGTNHTMSGNYTHTLTNHLGCDSVVTLHLTINNSNTGDTTAVACNSFSWYGTNHTMSGNYTHTLTNHLGCDSVVTLHLTINNSNIGDTIAVSCNSFSWYGTNHTMSGNYTHTLTNHLGCDSVVTLHLTINNSNIGDTTAVVCNNFSWYGTNHTMSGNYNHTLTNYLGCDSVVTLHLTINNSNTGDTTVVACNSFNWYGTNHTISGNYTHTLTNHLGCDSVVTLHLTVGSSYFYQETDTICDGSYLVWHGDTFTIAGIYYDSLLTQYGCDSVYELALTVNPTYFYSETDTICNGGYLVWHGDTFTIAGIYYDSLLTQNGCNSVYQLQLFVNPTYYFVEQDTICYGDSLIWQGISVNYYSVSDTLFANYNSVNGCDSIYELQLIVNLPYYFVEQDTVCFGDSLFWQGNYYSVADTFYVNYNSTSGCDSIYKLILTVNPLPNVVLSNYSPDTICDNLPQFNLPIGSPSGGSYSGSGVIGLYFDPAIAGIGEHWTYYNYTDSNSCSNIDSSKIVVIICSGIEDFSDKNNISIYPNPNKGKFTLKIDDKISQDYRMNIYNSLGMIIYSEDITSNGHLVKNINLQTHPKGVYIMILTSSEKLMYKAKIIIQ